MALDDIDGCDQDGDGVSPSDVADAVDVFGNHESTSITLLRFGSLVNLESLASVRPWPPSALHPLQDG